MRKMLLLALTALGLSMFSLPASVSAIEAFPTSQVHCTSSTISNEAAVCNRGATKDPIGGSGGILVKVTYILGWMGGAAAIILIIISGIKYMTASGDANKIASAKSTIINSIVGLAIIGLSTAILTFVIEKF